MDEEVEDLVGDVKYTDSQKSVATSNLYTQDFTDCSSEQQNSSGKDTYVIDCDSDDSQQSYLHEFESAINLKENTTQLQVQTEAINKYSKATSADFYLAQETFTQTSKTIIELAETEGGTRKRIVNKNLETQTSLLSISENKTIEFRIKLSETLTDSNNYKISGTQVLATSSSKFPVSESENETKEISDFSISSTNNVIKIINDKEFQEDTLDDTDELEYYNRSGFLKSDTDLDEDSLMCNEYNENKNYNEDATSDTSEVPKSIDSDVEDLYKKLSEKLNINVENACEQDTTRFSILSPLIEESDKVLKTNDNIMDITPNCSNIVNNKNNSDKYLVFTHSTGIKVTALPSNNAKSEAKFKLPPINKNHSCPTSPRLNFLFRDDMLQTHNKPYSLEEQKEHCEVDRWEIATKHLAAGESLLISGKSDPLKKNEKLPPIDATRNKYTNQNYNKEADPKQTMVIKTSINNSEESSNKIQTSECININDKIMELKMSSSNSKRHRPQAKYLSTSGSKTSRSPSPGSISPDESKLGDIAERGCDALCVELLKRLKSGSWFEIAGTLEELPKVMEKFWGVISENRIADLIRQVSCHVESPRAQVAQPACHTLAAILKNTKYTKKPDFYEAVTSLLVKTGSFSRPVRRAANVALDGVVCGVELTHAVTALCIHGVSHKSPLVRCAAARLLVVCCALAGGGRDLLRTRPPSAVSARRHALRALSTLLEDKTTETRKYAERLYAMLRPLINFEAFYLTDVDVDVATRQMKRYDQLLQCSPPKETR